MSIPASRIVTVNPSVLNSGGNSPILNGVFMTQNSLCPVGKVLSFNSADEVGKYFGQASDEYDLANRVYFNGYDNSLQKPGQLLIAPYVGTNRAAFLQSGFLVGLTIDQLKTYSGNFSITVDGDTKATGILNFSTITSFSEAATEIETALNTPTVIVDVSWNPVNATFLIESSTTGSSSTITYATDAVGSTLAANLKLTQTQGAILSQGSNVDTPVTAINNLVTNTTKWVSLTTLWEPVQDDKLSFASEINDLKNRYCYVYWDTSSDTVISNSTTCTAFKIQNANYNNSYGVSGSQAGDLGDTTRDAAVFVLGFLASVDFNALNGRATIAFKSLSGLLPTVSSDSDAEVLLANGYNFYGNYANSTNDWVFMYNGSLSGTWEWLDSFYGQVYLNQQFQTQLMTLLTSLNSIPYNDSGYGSIRLSLSQPIRDAINFGTIRVGIELSANQKAVVMAQARLDISNTLLTQGWYLQILPPSAEDRQQRKSPIINFWYTDGQSIQQITMNSIDIL